MPTRSKLKWGCYAPQGLPQFSPVGLPEGAVKESMDRVKPVRGVLPVAVVARE